MHEQKVKCCAVNEKDISIIVSQLHCVTSRVYNIQQIMLKERLNRTDYMLVIWDQTQSFL